MAGPRTQGPAGVDIDQGADRFAPGGSADPVGPIGLDSRPRRRVVRRIVKEVSKDWEPPQPRTTPEIVVNGRTLEEAGNQLDRLPEWGEGGGRIRADRIPAGTSEEVTVHLHANLVKRLPRWSRRGDASAAARAEWDRMLGALTTHENRHVEIAIEEADRCASELIGVEISEIARIVTEANRRMADRQVEFDNDTDHGRNAGVDLDISIR